jgi:hypothetical protein
VKVGKAVWLWLSVGCSKIMNILKRKREILVFSEYSGFLHIVEVAINTITLTPLPISNIS